jgi:hypothetical protein
LLSAIAPIQLYLEKNDLVEEKGNGE